MGYELVRVVIFGKTYPELSVKHTETVCTGALDVATGSPVRLYPVPLRYLDDGRAYSLYDEIAVPVAKSTSDPRPESFKVDAQRIQFVSQLGVERHWEARRELVFRNSSWHFSNMDALKRENLRSERSMGVVQPGEIVRISLDPKTKKEHEAYKKKSADVKALKEADLFDPTYKELEYLPYYIRMHWRCVGGCSSCAKQPHTMQVLDWGLLELARRTGWEKAVARLEHISDARTCDFRLFLGNFRLHVREFGIIGLWYPKIPLQGSLF